MNIWWLQQMIKFVVLWHSIAVYLKHTSCFTKQHSGNVQNTYIIATYY